MWGGILIANSTTNYYVFFLLGMLLLSFSSAPESGGVVTFGAPFLLIAIFLFVPVFIENLRTLHWTFLLWPTLFIFIIFLTCFIAADPVASLVRASANLVGFFLYLGIIAACMRTTMSVESVGRVLLLSGFVLSVYFVGNLLYSSLLYGFQNVILERYVGGAMSLPWGASNTIAQVLLLSVASYLVVDNKSRFDKVMLGVICLGILFTFSRSVIALLGCMLLVIFGVRYVISILLLGATALIGYISYFSSGSEEYNTFLSSRLSVENIESGNGRIDTVLEKINYFWGHPFEPIGYYSSVYDFTLSAHNYWITTLVEQSLIGVFVSLLFFLTIGRMAYRTSISVFFAFLIVMMGLMVEDPNFVQPYIISIWVYFALIVSSGLERDGRKGLSNA